jgi:hypothetical protein
MLLGNGIRLAMDFSRFGGSSMWSPAGEHARHLVAAGPVGLVVHRHRNHRDQRVVGQFASVGRNLRSTPDTRAITTSLTLTPKWFFTVLMSSRSSWANAMLRWPVTLALNAVFGAANGAAIARPLRARLTVSTTVRQRGRHHVDQLQSAGWRNLNAPLSAISSSLPPPTPSTGSGAGASGSVLH